ncbi:MULTISPECIES: methionine--tRNA ligase [Cysteiniphilum]|uniref:Methionine--tRNA ligase n=1 Tax=Cysteiniphilum litorale TaxID=2056700 RepID=A0A8J2Z5J8_9GAMM|nr:MULTISPECIES: methionine--tRNA ligase [Cysteiniphilum]GGG02648.1 methionine--tRNA ligase [Cysteiniphilum litorale]
MRNILVTNALPYANGHLHLGHMLGYIQSDIWVRFQKMRGNQCHFVCGSDTHGTPIMLKAKKEGIKPEKLVEQMSQAHRDDFIDFEVEFDNYHSTHHPLNQEIVEDIYLKLKANDLISTREIAQAYDPKAEMFLPDRFVKGTCPKCKAEDQYGDSCEVCGATYSPTDLINPKSVVSGETPIQKNSEHFFFKISQLSEDIQKWMKHNKALQPEVQNKLKEWFESGLQDWDISRDAPYFGFPIPGTNNKKFFYVWLDAPMGYIASFKDLCNRAGIDFDAYWRQDSKAELYHFIGKDIIYFHALFWPAILNAVDYRTPTGVFANGFLTVNGKKMSKSRGTFIAARTYLNHLKADYLRYYFASKLTPRIDDIDLNLEDFVQKVNSDVVGKVVNIASRCAGFINKRFDGMLSEHIHDQELIERFHAVHEEITMFFEKRDFSQALRVIMQLADQANQYVDAYKPWQLIKEEAQLQTVHEVCSLAINLFKIIIGYLKPVMPELVLKAEHFLNINQLQWAEIPNVLLGHKINLFKPLIARVEPEKIELIIEETKKMQSEAEQVTEVAPETEVKNSLNIANEIKIDDFFKVDLRVAQIIEAEHVEGSDKLLRLKLDLGQEQRQVFSGIKAAYNPENLVGKYTVMVANLAPRKMRFGLSEGMVLCAGDGDSLYLLEPDQGAIPGMRIS